MKHKWLIVTPVAALVLSTLSLNYSGFCWKEQKWLSDSEKIESAVARLLEEPRVSIHTKTHYTNYNVVPYKSTDSFLKANDACCDYVTSTGYNGFLSVFDKIVGFSSGVVTIHYRQNYLDEANKEGFNMFDADVVMSPCGKAQYLRQYFNDKVKE